MFKILILVYLFQIQNSLTTFGKAGENERAKRVFVSHPLLGIRNAIGVSTFGSPQRTINGSPMDIKF